MTDKIKRIECIYVQAISKYSFETVSKWNILSTKL